MSLYKFHLFWPVCGLDKGVKYKHPSRRIARDQFIQQPFQILPRLSCSFHLDRSSTVTSLFIISPQEENLSGSLPDLRSARNLSPWFIPSILRTEQPSTLSSEFLLSEQENQPQRHKDTKTEKKQRELGVLVVNPVWFRLGRVRLYLFYHSLACRASFSIARHNVCLESLAERPKNT